MFEISDSLMKEIEACGYKINFSKQIGGDYFYRWYSVSLYDKNENECIAICTDWYKGDEDKQAEIITDCEIWNTDNDLTVKTFKIIKELSVELERFIIRELGE